MSTTLRLKRILTTRVGPIKWERGPWTPSDRYSPDDSHELLVSSASEPLGTGNTLAEALSESIAILDVRARRDARGVAEEQAQRELVL